MHHQLNPAAEAQATLIGLCVLEDAYKREVAMNSPLLVVLIVIAFAIGGAVTTVKKACKKGYHSWCVPTSTVRHHVKTEPPI